MSFTNELILEEIKKFGINNIIDNIDIEKIEDITIKCIARTIQQSKEILLERLEEYVQDEKNNNPDFKMNG